ncbi:MAG: winged helix-turn-helix transcriptional regulator [Candidatus Diapherotrites archaeon]|nr:winged helix-turn-helix transcriptional regulator [Candidatus Diapherotrites archaeon]
MVDITLDKQSFKALSSDSRVNLLKALKKRRKTLTELSKELSLGVSTTKEHLQHLEKAGLIEQVDEGYKWKYYELTSKGSGVVSPESSMRINVLLGSALASVFVTASLLFNKVQGVSQVGVAMAAEAGADVMSAPTSAPLSAPVAETVPVVASTVPTLAQLPLFELSLLAVSLVFFVAAFYVWWKK